MNQHPIAGKWYNVTKKDGTADIAYHVAGKWNSECVWKNISGQPVDNVVSWIEYVRPAANQPEFSWYLYDRITHDRVVGKGMTNGRVIDPVPEFRSRKQAEDWAAANNINAHAQQFTE